MTGVKIELLVEFAVILLAPVIHAYYLWKCKKVEREVLIKNIRIFAVLYMLFGLVSAVYLLK